jgi:hypothetical protein
MLKVLEVWAGGVRVADIVEYLTSKYEALISNPVLPKKIFRGTVLSSNSIYCMVIQVGD